MFQNYFFFILLLKLKGQSIKEPAKSRKTFYSFLSLFQSLQNNLVVSISKNRSKFTQSHNKRISKEFKCKFSDDKSFSVFVKNKLEYKQKVSFYIFFILSHFYFRDSKTFSMTISRHEIYYAHSVLFTVYILELQALSACFLFKVHIF